jgi:hypothetical protein
LQSKADEYRARAAECARRAELSRDPEVQSSYKEMAMAWLRLADYADEKSQKGHDGNPL